MTGGVLEYSGENLLFEEIEQKKRIRSYIPSCFIICPLPVRSLEGSEKEYVKRFNNFELKLIGANGIPGGKIARDLLMLFTTEAVVNKHNLDQRVKLKFKNLVELQRAIGMNLVNHGERVIDIIEKYSGCSIYFQADIKHKFDGQTLLFDGEMFKGMKGYNEKDVTLKYRNITNVSFINRLERVDMIRSKCKKGEPVSIELTLTSEFVDMVKDNAVPVDFTVYKEIQGPMMQDLYVWLVYKNYNYRNKNETETYISKKKMVEQFGNEGEKNENMKYQRILEALGVIKKLYYEDLSYEIVDNGKRREKGIILHKSPVVIKDEDKRYVPLLTNMGN